jgi:capsular polysaccharide biosynthesis protein
VSVPSEAGHQVVFVWPVGEHTSAKETSMSDRVLFDTYRRNNFMKSLFRPAWKWFRRMPRKVKLGGARTAARVLPFISIDKDRLYPPSGVWESTPEWVSKVGQQYQAKITNVDAACTVSNALPKTMHGSVRQQFSMDQTHVFPETFVATIPRGRVTNRGFVMTPDRQFLHDVSAYFHDPKRTVEAALAHDWKLEPLTEIDGRVAVLATEAASLYYHWLFQLLPRYELLRRARVELESIDHFYVNNRNSKFQRETLAALGIDPSKVIDGDRVGHLRARELIVPSVPLGAGCFRPWMTEFLRDSFIPKNSSGTKPFSRRLYISRGQAVYRRTLNEEEVVKLLQKYGFEVFQMEGLSVQEQAAVMASCEAVVAPHGGGLSNIVFCSPGTKIIEIFSPELVATYFWKLSNELKLDYYYLLGKGSPATLDADYPQSWDARADIEVDLEILEKTLKLANID